MEQRFVKIKNWIFDFSKILGWYIGNDYINIFLFNASGDDATVTIDDLSPEELEIVVMCLQTKFVKDNII